jgi:ABC-type uncharacterized transport system substrate-binding protein
MTTSPEHVREGMLMSFGPNEAASYRRAGTYIDKILKGAKPADLNRPGFPGGSNP